MKRIVLLLLPLALLVLIWGCGNEKEEVLPTNPDPTTTLDALGVSDNTAGFPSPIYWYTATAPIGSRIHQSDVVVRASLASTGDGLLTFRVLEYLKGTGDATVSVTVSTGDRDTSYDSREALLFLTHTSDDAASGDGARSTDSTSANLSFTTIVEEPEVHAEGYAIDGNNPVWLPAAASESGSSNGVRSASNPSRSDADYIVEDEGPDGAPNPVVSLSEIKEQIAWQARGETDAEWAYCIRSSLYWESIDRDFQAYYGRDRVGDPRTHSMESGSPAGGLIRGMDRGAYQLDEPALYDQMTITGDHGHLLEHIIIDDDSDPTNGYRSRSQTARPLPAGVYSATITVILNNYAYCGYDFAGRLDTGEVGTDHEITVTAPDNAVHEAFFDPQTIGSRAGYSDSAGILSPAGFILGETATTISSLYTTGDAVTMTLSPYVDLTGHTLDFITGDGTTTLSLTGATGDATAGTLTWAVSGQPWSSGDELMLRISEPPPPPPAVTVALSPREDEYLPLTYTDMTISWTDPETCTAQYFVGLYEDEGETVVRIWGFHPVTTTSLSKSTFIIWDSLPNNTWTARVTCTNNDWRTVGDVPLASVLPR